jgi:hypothetical protein
MHTPTFMREGRPDPDLYTDFVRNERDEAKKRPATERGPEERQNTYEQS